MRTAKRALVISAAGLLLTAGFNAPALANHGPSCSILTGATVQQGGTLSVAAAVGPAQVDNSSGEFHQLRLGGTPLGNGVADGVGHFTVSGSVPGAFTPGIHPVDVVRISGPAPGLTIPCGNVEVVEAAAPAPTPTPDPDPDPTPPAPAPAATEPPPAAVPAQQQQQQQQQQQVEVVPVVLQHGTAVTVPSGPSLPKTGAGADVGSLTTSGVASLLIGLALADFARRRRGLRLASGTGAETRSFETGPPVEEIPPSTTEGDLLVPYER